MAGSGSLNEMECLVVPWYMQMHWHLIQSFEVAGWSQSRGGSRAHIVQLHPCS